LKKNTKDRFANSKSAVYFKIETMGQQTTFFIEYKNTLIQKKKKKGQKEKNNTKRVFSIHRS